MKNNFLALCLCLASFSAFAQSQVFESLSMKSKLLNTDVKYSVYLPDGYESSKQNYPVVYLLNGFQGDELSWIMNGNLKDIVDKLISDKTIHPMVIVMPDGDDRLYMNRDDGTYPFEDMFITELIPFIENEYKINAGKASRAISGLSMGGSGSLRWAFLYPELFQSCAAFSPGISTEEQIMNEPSLTFEYYFSKVSPSIFDKKGKDRLTKTVKDYEVLNHVEKLNPETFKDLHIYFDCGDDDFLTIGSSELHIALTKKRIPHEFRMRDGSHNWEFWKASLPIGLSFISKHFK